MKYFTFDSNQEDKFGHMPGNPTEKNFLEFGTALRVGRCFLQSLPEEFLARTNASWLTQLRASRAWHSKEEKLPNALRYPKGLDQCYGWEFEVRILDHGLHVGDTMDASPRALTVSSRPVSSNPSMKRPVLSAQTARPTAGMSSRRTPSPRGLSSPRNAMPR
jgi:hypothetical protein